MKNKKYQIPNRVRIVVDSPILKHTEDVWDVDAVKRLEEIKEWWQRLCNHLWVSTDGKFESELRAENKLSVTTQVL